MTVKANPTGAFLGDSDTQNVSGAKTFSNTTLLQRNPANTFSLTWVHPAITANRDRRAYQPYNYLVYAEGGTVYVKNGLTEAIDHSGATVATEIQWALDNLTAARTAKETVILQGNFTVGTMLQVPSYTKLVINGTLTQTASSTLSALIRNKDYGVTQQSNIEICGGGVLDGNESNGATANGLVMYGVTDQMIHDLTIKNFGGPSAHGLYIGTNSSSLVSHRVLVNNILIDNVEAGAMEVAGTGDGVETTSVQHVNISNVIGRNSTDGRGLAFTNVWYGNVVNFHAIDNIGGTGRGIDVGYGSHDNTLTNCYATGSSLDGFVVADSPGADPADRTHWINCYAYANDGNGFEINASDCTVVGGASHSNGLVGCRVDQHRNKIIGLTCKNNSLASVTTWSGFDIRGDNNLIEGCQAYDSQGTKTQRYGISIAAGGDNNLILGNMFYDNQQAANISNLGTGNLFDNNHGFFNKGEATFSGTGAQTAFTITHGLKTTPTYALITPTTADASGVHYVSAYGATTFTVTYPVAPASGTNNVKMNWRASVF
jgi:hypothetical protein